MNMNCHRGICHSHLEILISLVRHSALLNWADSFLLFTNLPADSYLKVGCGRQSLEGDAFHHLLVPGSGSEK